MLDSRSIRSLHLAQRSVGDVSAMTMRDGSPVFVVGTRFQAIMADSVRRHLKMRRYEVVNFFQERDESRVPDMALDELVRSAERVVSVDRRNSAFSQFSELVRETNGAGRAIFLAAVSNPLLMAVFRVNPRLKLFTFDEGSYNIDPAGPFHNPRDVSGFSAKSLFYRFVHPRGPINFARRVSKRHYTPFREDLNVFHERCERISVEWMRYADPGEVRQFAGCRSVLVLPCLQDLEENRRAEVLRLANSDRFELVIRHPRDASGYGIASQRLRSPVESLIDALRRSNSVRVFHFASTVGLTLKSFDCVEIVDLCIECGSFEQ